MSQNSTSKSLIELNDSLKSKLQTLGVPDDNESKRPRRNEPSAKIRLGELKCLFCLKIDSEINFCAAGTMHATSKTCQDHVEAFTEKIKLNSSKLGEAELSAKLSPGDLATNELFYHKSCLKQFNNRYESAILK